MSKYSSTISQPEVLQPQPAPSNLSQEISISSNEFQEISISSNEFQEISISSNESITGTFEKSCINKPICYSIINDTKKLLLQKTYLYLQNKNITIYDKNQLLLLIQIIIELLQNENLKGYNKKKYAILILETIIKESTMNNIDKEICYDFITNSFASLTIDTIIHAAKGKTNITNTTFQKFINYIKKNLCC